MQRTTRLRCSCARMCWSPPAWPTPLKSNQDSKWPAVEHIRQQEVEQAPQLAQVVLQRRACAAAQPLSCEATVRTTMQNNPIKQTVGSAKASDLQAVII